MELNTRLQHWQQRIMKALYPSGPFLTPRERVIAFFQSIKTLGFTTELDDLEKRKLGVFNLLNFFQLLTGVLVPIIGLFQSSSLPAAGWLVASFPAVVSIVVLILNSRFQYRSALLFYFICYPVFTCFIYISGMNLGVELSFILYGILAVFFLQDFGYMVFSIGLSMVSYFILSVVLKNYQYQLESFNVLAYFLNQGLAIIYIFYGLYLIKKETTNYELSIMQQKAEMAEQAILLKQQAEKMEELNSLKNKLFSVISHDLKTPMYALRNFFISAKELRLPAREIRAMLPDVINDLNYTTGLMENLLHWAKSQMQSNTVRAQDLDMNSLIEDTIQLMRIQAEAKKITIERRMSMTAHAYGDRDMINLVVRNLLSNAIKFTPMGGHIVVGVHELLGNNDSDSFTEVYIQDSGPGIPREVMQKINENVFYTTPGTASEGGTGLGLMLCREFLGRNQGRMMIESEPGNGSTFSFSLPQAPAA